MTIEEKWQKYHNNNPHIYELFKRFTFDVLKTHKHYSSDAILHRIRWFTNIETNTDGDFKINNNWTAYYARLFMDDYPEYDGCFKTRSANVDGL